MNLPEDNQLVIPNGVPLSVACRHAVDLAQEQRRLIFFEFNGVRVDVVPEDSPDDVFERYFLKKEKK